MIVRSRVVVTMDGPPIRNGAVAIEGATITDVGTFAEISSRNCGEVFDLGEQVLLPGLINAHCHLDYTMLRGKIRPPASFTDWIQQINDKKAALSEEDYLASIAEGFAEAKQFGTTSLINLEAFPKLIAKIGRAPIRTWWCPEIIDVRSKMDVDETFDILRSGFNLREHFGKQCGLSPHAPYTASSHLYHECSDVGRRANLLVTTHLAESREEMQMFHGAHGPLFDFMKSLGRPMDDCGKKTPTALLLEEVELDQRWVIAHLNELTEDDFALVREKKFHIVHCPRSHRYFGHSRFALHRLRSLGLNICLGTDSLASNSSLSLFDEMRELQRVAPSLSPRDLLEMVTANPANALGQANVLGRIARGFRADLISLPLSDSRADPFETILAFDKPVTWMMVDGRRV